MPTKSRTFAQKKPAVYIRTFGCQMNSRDTEALLGLFVNKGYTVADSARDADVVLINTCSVRAHAEDRAASYAGTFKKLGNKKPIVGLIGCMAKNKGQELFNKMSHIDLICGPESFSDIPDNIAKIIKDKIRIIDLEDRERDEAFYGASLRLEPDVAQVVISTGCSNYCSYCVVPFVRGKLRLRKPSDITDEVRRNIVLGRKKIILLGQNVNDYKYRRQTTDYRLQIVDFVELLHRVLNIQGLESLDFITSQPRNTSKELFTLMAKSSKIRKHFHLPFQSGSDRILKLMNRGYTKEKYLGLVDDYKKIVGGTLSTDVIVGFPTESDEDFNQSRDILEKVKFSHAFIFKYSPRNLAKSIKLADDVSVTLKVRRHKILLDLQKRISRGG